MNSFSLFKVTNNLLCNRFTSVDSTGLGVNKVCSNVPLINYLSGHNNDVISNLAFYWNGDEVLNKLVITCQVDCQLETRNTFKKINAENRLECQCI
jgi:hypothetical protein